MTHTHTQDEILLLTRNAIVGIDLSLEIFVVLQLALSGEETPEGFAPGRRGEQHRDLVLVGDLKLEEKAKYTSIKFTDFLLSCTRVPKKIKLFS